MTLQELRYLVALADAGHFARAAEACHISQSTLSVQVKKLEEYLKVTLFDRSLRRVTTSPVASEIVASARLIVAEADRIRSLAREKSSPMARTFNLGVISTLGPYLMPRVLPTLHKLYPELRLLLREELTQTLFAHLASGALDAALVALPVPLEGLECEPLFTEPFLAALPATHPLTARSKVRRDELVGASLLLLEEGHCLREQALEFCGQRPAAFAEEVRGTSLEMLRQMVALEIGYTIMPALAVGAVAQAGKALVEYRPFASPVPARMIGLVWRHRSAAHFTCLTIAKAMRSHAPKEVTLAAKDVGRRGKSGRRQMGDPGVFSRQPPRSMRAAPGSQKAIRMARKPR
jgi:LysR family transcriptional regulator, hydrogen peroxide-inducible genes activator